MIRSMALPKASTPAPLLLALAAALLLCLAPLAAQAQGTSAKAYFQSRYDALAQATKSRNPDRIRPFLTRDYLNVDATGRRLTGDQMMVELQRVPADSSANAKTTVMQVDMAGKVARVQTQFSTSFKQTGQDRRQHTVGVTQQSTDTWVQVGQDWLIKSAIAGETAMTLDGRPVPLPQQR